MIMNSIVIFCGSSDGLNNDYAKEAFSIGKKIAKSKIKLIYGGAKIGIMGQVASGVLANGGTVIGVIPKFLKKKEIVHSNLNQLIITQNMHERKQKMHELSDGIIMLPGGYGTLEEFFEMLTWAQLGLHKNPIAILNTNGFYDNLLKMLEHMVSQGFVKQIDYDMILVSKCIDTLLKKMKNH